MMTRAVNVELFKPWSVWRIMQMSNARAMVSVGLSPLSMLRKFSANPSEASGLTKSSPRRCRSK